MTSDPQNIPDLKWSRRAAWLVVTFAVLVVSILVFTTPDSEAYTGNARVVCREFGPRYCQLAVRVARCESTLRVRARNGQYWGLFQVSAGLRRDYTGFAWNAAAQARHAHKIFNASGKTFHRKWYSSEWCWS